MGIQFMRRRGGVIRMVITFASYHFGGLGRYTVTNHPSATRSGLPGGAIVQVGVI